MKYEINLDFKNGQHEIKQIKPLNPVQIVFKGSGLVNILK